MKRRRVVYVTSSTFKQQENLVFQQECHTSDGVKVADAFDFQIQSLSIKEVLEIDLSVMVQVEVVNAYSQIKVPCIVEHAGLIFLDLKDKMYPGGLTKPMWNALDENFIKETNSAGRPVIARAVVGYCNGVSVKTFVGETEGKIASLPRGGRRFYWDTVFEPKQSNPDLDGKTYAEIVEDSRYGLAYKVSKLSQSSKAMLSFLEYLKTDTDDFFGPQS